MPLKTLSVGPKHHFFGYYGINPWDSTGTYHLALETDFHTHRPGPEDVAAVGLIHRETHEFTAYAKTSAFNLQQGSMLHWLDDEFTFNDWEADKLVSRAVNPGTGKVRTLHGAIAAVSPTAPLAIGLNYARMAHCRAVVGYANEMNPHEIVAQPEDDGLYLLNLQDGSARLVLSIAEVVRKSRDERLVGGRTWFNHVLFNTDGTRLLFFCRCRHEKGFYSSLWTVNPDGADLAMQIPFGYRVSHFDWRTPTQILVSSDITGEMGFVEFTDGAHDFTPFGRGVLPSDGHASFSPDRRWLLCDTYPRGAARLAELMVYNIAENQFSVVREAFDEVFLRRGVSLRNPSSTLSMSTFLLRQLSLGKFHHEEQFTSDIRCDLHPRWAGDGTAVTFDSVHEGTRQIYHVDLKPLIEL